MEMRAPVWLFLLAATISLVGGVLFAALVAYNVGGGQKFAAVGRVAVAVAKFPAEAIAALRQILPANGISGDPYPGQAGLRSEGFVDDGYLLLSSGDPGRAATTVKLIRLLDGKVLHRWRADFRKIDVKISSQESDGYFHYQQLIHPLLTDDGGVVGHSEPGPLIKLDQCSRVKWIVPGKFHHAVEVDDDGNVWASSYAEHSDIDPHFFPDFKDNTIVEVSAGGKVLFTKSVADILIANGYRGLLFGQEPYNNDPIHLNQVDPVRGESKYWEKGDVLVSIRNRSAIFLYRPKTNKILWLKIGPWLAQHDARVVDGSHISVFGNDVMRYGDNSVGVFPYGHSDIYVYDLDTGQTEAPFDGLMARLHVKMDSEGRARILSNGDVFVEQTDTGRLMRLGSKNVRWVYVAREHPGDPIAVLNWSRYLPVGRVEPILPHLECRDGGRMR